jgi:tetratricopeptide (TPR) repeat protein
MPPAEDLFDRARQCHRAGDLRQAERLYRQALQLQPGSSGACYGLGHVLGEQGRWQEALAQYREALRLLPGSPEVLNDLGVALAALGHPDEAAARLHEAIRCRPDFAPAHRNLGALLAQRGQPDEALRRLEEALRLQPGDPETCYNLGNVLRQLGRNDEAIAYYRQALQGQPGRADAYNNLGLALIQARRFGEAAVLLRQGVRLRPQEVSGHNNLGLALSDLGQFAEAEASFHEALRLQPGYVDAHNNLGIAYRKQGRLAEALAAFDVALWLDPRSVGAHFNRALALLQRGDLAEGWAEYEWRWQFEHMTPPSFPRPRWDGSPLAGRTILLTTEQGLGDTIQFIRYAPLLHRQGARVLVQVPAALVALLGSCAGIERLVARGERLPEFDVHAPLLSLPGLLGTALDTIPAEVPYLAAEPARVEAWRQRLEGVRGFRVGIVWQGGLKYPDDHWRSVPLVCFAPLADVPGVRLVSLQKGPGTEQLESVRFPVARLAPEPDAEGGAFLDTAAVMKNLDLLVMSDTSATHLAGALGVPVWMATSAAPDWRWLSGREDSPWYPTLRLFRQGRLGDWAGVFDRMAAELRRLVPRGEDETEGGGAAS